jgi:reversibly glycosylated polypeptide/UDP-arabinopyranose mutase
MKIGVVVAHHHETLGFLLEWEQLKRPDVHIYVVEDREQSVCKLPPGFQGKIYDHRDIRESLGTQHWIIPKRTSACKSFGFIKAYEDGCDVTITIDNDCFPDGSNLVDGHVSNLLHKTTLGWFQTISELPPRGFIYSGRGQTPFAISHGLWSNIPDLDAPTALHNPRLRLSPATQRRVVPQFNYYPMCGMNLAFWTKYTPMMYFGLQGPDWDYDRFDDIWAGIFTKKICDHLGLAVASGYPSVEHRKQSDVYANLVKEAKGIGTNEKLWKVVDGIQLKGVTIHDCYDEIAQELSVAFADDLYWAAQTKAMQVWTNLFR